VERLLHKLAGKQCRPWWQVLASALLCGLIDRFSFSHECPLTWEWQHTE